MKYVKKEFKKQFQLIIGQYTAFKKFKMFKNLEIKNNPKSICYLMVNCKNIITRFGLTAYEAMSINIKPTIWLTKQDTGSRKKTIHYLHKKGLLNIFNKKNNLKFKNSEIKFGAVQTTKLIENHFS